MRLENVRTGHRLPQKIKLGLIRLLSGEPAADIVRTVQYRPELFGHHISVCCQEALRGPSEWSVGERELFAAFVSSRNRCQF